MLKPLVSIVIPVFNREEIIKDTLDSIKAQTYENWECVLVDDHSTDHTETTIKSYIDKDSRFKFFVRPEQSLKGANACRNYGFKVAEGAFINWFDSDDVMAPEFLESKLKAFTNETNAVMHRNQYGNYSLTKFRTSKFEHKGSESLFYHYALDQIEIQTCSFLWRRSFLHDKSLFDEAMQRFQDNEFHIRMLVHKPLIMILDTVLATVRGGDGDSSQISSSTNITKRKLYDIFFYRYQCYILSSVLKDSQEQEVSKVASKKALWSFYDMLRFDKQMKQRFNDTMLHKNKLKNIYLNKEFNAFDRLKSYAYLWSLIVFGSRKYKS